MTDEEFVQALYEVVLGRSPDCEGREAALAHLGRGTDPREILRWFVEGEEFAARIQSRNRGAEPSVALARQHQPAILELLAPLAPHDVAGSGKVRVGRDNDGGYVMVDDFAGLAAAYSLGIADDASWDKQIARLGLDVFQYDHTIPHLPEADARFRWRRRKVVGTRSDDPSSITLAEAFGENGHMAGGDYLLKIDVEGAEWDIFSAIEPGFLRAFRQIVCEFHGFEEAADPVQCALMRCALINLTAHHRVVHVHANNSVPWALLGGVAVPGVLEVTLVRADDHTFAPAAGTFPTPLDQPNDPERADLQLGHFRFGR